MSNIDSRTEPTTQDRFKIRPLLILLCANRFLVRVFQQTASVFDPTRTARSELRMPENRNRSEQADPAELPVLAPGPLFSVTAAQEIPKPKNWQDLQRGCDFCNTICQYRKSRPEAEGTKRRRLYGVSHGRNSNWRAIKNILI